MAKFTDEEREEIVLEYFGPEGTKENPRCPSCGEVLQLESEYPSGSSGFRLLIRCPDCQTSDVWEQKCPSEAWTTVQPGAVRRR